MQTKNKMHERRVAVALAVQIRGLAQGVGQKERLAAVDAAIAQMDCGSSAAWAVVVGGWNLDYWTRGRKARWSVALAGAMP